MAQFHLPKKKCAKKMSSRRPAKGSYRWIKRGKTYLLLACPVGKYSKRTRTCKANMFAVEKVKARKGRSCPVGQKKS